MREARSPLTSSVATRNIESSRSWASATAGSSTDTPDERLGTPSSPATPRDGAWTQAWRGGSYIRYRPKAMCGTVLRSWIRGSVRVTGPYAGNGLLPFVGGQPHEEVDGLD